MLGIDPSTVATGWGVVEGARYGDACVLASGTIKPGKASLQQRVAYIYTAVQGLLAGPWAIAAIAIEDQFMGRNAKTLKALAYITGVVMLAAVQKSVAVYLYEPTVARRVVAGHGKASKAQVHEAVKVLTGLDTTTLDESDAIAVALAHLQVRCPD